jgi:hypothetical protein
MERESGFGAEGFPSVQNSTAQAGFEQNKQSATGGIGYLQSTGNFQNDWWESGWFKEWEQVARREK